MAICGYDVTVRSGAPPPAVCALLTEPPGWPDWTPIDSFDRTWSAGLDTEGRSGVGTVQVFRTGDVVTGERIVELIEYQLFRYEGAFNPFMRRYQARVELTELSGGATPIRWHGRYEVSWWLRPLYPCLLQHFMTTMATGLANRAEELV